jgi:hypothetical protein
MKLFNLMILISCVYLCGFFVKETPWYFMTPVMIILGIYAGLLAEDR